MHTTRFINAVAATSLALAACGGSSGTTSSGTQVTAETTRSSDSQAPVETTAATQPPATEPPATDAPTTTAPPAPLPEPFDLATLPDLVAAADAAIADPTIDPFTVVDDVVGFPVPIPAPDGSSLRSFDASLSSVDEDGTTGWDARYVVVAPGGVVDDIDLDLDGNGPGSQQLIDIFDPIMIDLGFERKNSNASDPGDKGGPNSVNHVYVAADPSWDVNGVPAALDPVFITSTEDINGWAYDDTRPELAGYRFDVGFDTAPATGDEPPTPFPLVNSVIEAFPLPAGPTLDDVSVQLQIRAPDAYSIDDGDSYIEIYITWAAPPEMFDDLAAFYADPTTVFTDESVFMAGEDSFFEEGTIGRTEPSLYDGTDHILDVLLLQRYGARFGIAASDDGIEPLEVSIRITLNPNDVELALPTE